MIQDQISRLQNAKYKIIDEVQKQGVSIPGNTKIDNIAEYIDMIPGGTAQEYKKNYQGQTNIMAELNRIKMAKENIKKAIEKRGIKIPEKAPLDSYYLYVSYINKKVPLFGFPWASTTESGFSMGYKTK